MTQESTGSTRRGDEPPAEPLPHAAHDLLVRIATDEQIREFLETEQPAQDPPDRSGWLPPEYIGNAIIHQWDDDTGAEGLCMHLCEWCGRRAEYHERNHDRFLCRSCAFDVAPNKPVFQIRRCEVQQTRDTPEDLTHRLGYLVCQILLAAQGA